MAKVRNFFRNYLARVTTPHGAVSQLARDAGMARATVDKWLRDESTPTLDALEKVAEALRVHPAELVGGSSGASLPADVQAVVSALMTLNEAQRALVVGPFTEAIREFHEINAGERASPITGKKQKQK